MHAGWTHIAGIAAFSAAWGGHNMTVPTQGSMLDRRHMRLMWCEGICALIGCFAREKADREMLQLEVAPRPAIATIVFLTFLSFLAVTGVARASMLADEHVWNSFAERPASQTQLRLSDGDVLRANAFVRQESAVRGNGSGVAPVVMRTAERDFPSSEVSRKHDNAVVPVFFAGHSPRAPPAPARETDGPLDV